MFFWWPPMFNWGPGPAAGDEFSKPLSLAKSTWAQYSWAALATHISHFSRSSCLFFFTLIPVWLGHAMSRSKARGNGNPSWGWGYNLLRSPHYVGGGGNGVLPHSRRCFSSEGNTQKHWVEMLWFPKCVIVCDFMPTSTVIYLWGVLVFLSKILNICIYTMKKCYLGK